MKIDISLRKQPTNGKNEPVYLRFNDYNSKLFKGNKRFWYKTDYTLKKGSDIKKLPIQARHILENWIIEIEKDFNDVISADGARRYAWVYPTEVEGRFNKVEAQYELNFTLPKGSYATVLIEELAKKKIK
jgi:tRNA(Glu) U13 pseudouridine synthase TruD